MRDMNNITGRIVSWGRVGLWSLLLVAGAVDLSRVAIVTVVPCAKRDRTTGEAVPVRKAKRTTVFHVSQTDVLQVPGVQA